MDAVQINEVMFSLRVIAIACVVIALIVLLILLEMGKYFPKFYENSKLKLDATRCIICKMVGSEVCWNGFKDHCESMKDKSTEKKEG